MTQTFPSPAFDPHVPSRPVPATRSGGALRHFQPAVRATALLALLLAGAVGGVPALAADDADVAPRPGWADLAPILPEGTDLSGHAVYLDFWASWCPPCRKSFPWMIETARTFGPAGLEVVAVCMDKDLKKAEAFLAGQGEIPFRIVYDPKGEVARAFDLQAMPTSLLFSPDGTLISRHVGFGSPDAEALHQELARLFPDAGPKEPQQP